MTTTPLLLKIFLLAVTSRKSSPFVSSERSGLPWGTLWKKMNVLDNNVNYKSSCPWQYVRNSVTGDWQPQLLQIREKWCTMCCIDLNQSNASHLVINPRGQCSEVRANMQCNNTVKRIVVGYTCIYALSLPTDKRNDGKGPIVNHRLTFEPTSSTIQTQFSATTDDKKYVETNSKKGNEMKEGFDKEQNEQYATSLNQHVVPAFLGNAQLKQPAFLENNNNQFRPVFLNAMNPQIGQPPVLPMFPLNEHVENVHRSLTDESNNKKEDETSVHTNESEGYMNDQDKSDIEETNDEIPFSENLKKPLR